MSRLVILDVRPDAPWHRPTALLHEIAATPDLDFAFTSDPETFETLASIGGPIVALAIVHGPLDHAAADVLTSVSERAPTAILAHSPTQETLRALLDLGVSEVFADPIAPRRLLTTLLGLLRGGRGDPHHGVALLGHPGWLSTTAMHAVEPVSCTVRVRGGPDLAGHWVAVAGGAFEVSVSRMVEEGDLVEVIGAPGIITSSAGVFGRVVHVDSSPGSLVRLWCEALPVSDHPPLWVVSPRADSSASRSSPSRASGAKSSRSSQSQTLRPAEVVRFDPAVLGGLVVVLLVLALLGWMALIKESPAAQQPATTREVLDGIERAFE